MEQPFNFDETIARLVKTANESGTLHTPVLDDLVHDTASSIASGINNEGTEAQIKYLLENAGPASVNEIEALLKEESEDLPEEDR